MRILVQYHSLSGNTEEVAKLIGDYVGEQGIEYLVSDINYNINLELYDHVFIGTYTWGDGDLPTQMRDYLKFILKESNFKLPTFSVFGTGETQFTYYCRAVDEMEYHLSRHTKVINKLKIEQHPINQIDKVKEYTKNVLEEIKCN